MLFTFCLDTESNKEVKAVKGCTKPVHRDYKL